MPEGAAADSAGREPVSNTVAGAGMVEPETENISIGSPLPGIVVEVMVKVGQHVKAGDPLFRIDDRERKAELKVRQAMLADATAALERLEAMPRPEELPAAEAKVNEAKADWDNWEQQWSRGEKLVTDRAISEEEFLERKQSAMQARERYNRAVADLNLLKAGSWEPDKRVAKSAVERVQSQINQAQTELDRLTVRALVDGEVLQVNVRPGEFVGATAGQALIVLGSVTQLHVRVDIDEYDIPRFIADAPARATLKGQRNGFLPAEIRAHRAVRGAQEIAHRRQHRARRYPRAAGDLRDRHDRQTAVRRPAVGCVYRCLAARRPASWLKPEALIELFATGNCGQCLKNTRSPASFPPLTALRKGVNLLVSTRFARLPR